MYVRKDEPLYSVLRRKGRRKQSHGQRGHLERVRKAEGLFGMPCSCAPKLQTASQLIQASCRNGAAVEVYKKERPDLVLMDITMPVMDGIEAVKGIEPMTVTPS